MAEERPVPASGPGRPRPALILVPLGPLPTHFLEPLARFLDRTAGLECRVEHHGLDARVGYDPGRGQSNCRTILPLLEALAGRLGARVLGVADIDLFSPIFTFVFGEARLGGQAGLFSIHRLRPALYGLPDDRNLIEARARREALHEAGHLLGLVHCRRPDCAMRFSGSAEEVDLKPDAWCGECEARAAGALSTHVDAPPAPP